MTNGIGLILLFEFVLIILSNVYGIFIYIIFSKQYCSFIDVYKIFYGTMGHHALCNECCLNSLLCDSRKSVLTIPNNCVTMPSIWQRVRGGTGTVFTCT